MLDQQPTSLAGDLKQESSAPNDTGWISSLPEDLRADPNVTKFKSQVDMIKAYKESQKEISQRVRIPNEASSEEYRKQFYDQVTKVPGIYKLPENDIEADQLFNKLGRPETADKYALKNVPADVRQALPQLKDFLAVAHKARLTDGQVDNLVEWNLIQQKEAQSQFDQQRKVTQEALTKKYGHEYDNKLKSADQVLNHYAKNASESDVAKIRAAAVQNPTLIMLLNDLSEIYQEKGHVGHVPYSGSGMTPDAARAEVDAAYANPHTAYRDPKHPNHDSAVKRVSDLFRIINGEA